MKVLMVGPARSVNGGISAVVNNYYQAKLDQKAELTYIATMEDGSKWHKLRVALGAVLRYLTALPGHTIVHIHMASDISIYRKSIFIWLAKLFGKKLVIHQHGGNIKQFYEQECGRIKQYWIRKTLQKADVFLVVAPYLKEIFQKILEKEKIRVFPNAIEIPKEEKASYEGQNLLFLGRLCKEKGVYELLEAVKELEPVFPNLQLYLGGVWEDAFLKEKAEADPEHVHDLGWIGAKQKEQYLKQCNILVLPTYFEGLPMSLLEGMAYGCACVASEVGGIPEVITDKENGLLIPAKEVGALKEAIQKLLEDPALQKSLGENARRTVEKDYDIRQSVDNLLQIYAALEK